MAGIIVVLVVFLALAWVWLKQFVWLMMLDDKTFPGQYDKIIWGAAFVFLFVLAPFAFILWKSAIGQLGKAESDRTHAQANM